MAKATGHESVCAVGKDESKQATCQSRANAFTFYCVFMLVGCACGWFVCNGTLNILANAPETQKHGKMWGTFSLTQGIVGLGSAALYFVYCALVPDGLSLRNEQLMVVGLLATTLVTFIMMAAFWNVDAPTYPFVIAANALGNLIGNATSYVLFPLVATHYAGWLVAVVRIGSDASSMVTSLIGEMQIGRAMSLRFPMWTLLSVYAALAACGLCAWVVIMGKGVGLRSGVNDADTDAKTGNADCRDLECSEGTQAAKQTSVSGFAPFRQALRGMACPRHLVAPVVLATVAQVAQWSVILSIGEIGSAMTDPISCSGTRGAHVYRQALTLSNVLVPACSMLSSFARCPRWLFNSLFVLQTCACLTACSAVLGYQRAFWITTRGQSVYVTCCALVAGLEGYLITMAYRYIGDADDLPQARRLSASRLLSVAGVVSVCSSCIILGALVSNETIACHPQ